ncbi:MAG: OmpP1/FadL family transporter [Candidatus Aminicenantales bacterium]
MRKGIPLLLSIASFFIVSSSIHGEGFFIWEQGAAAMAMGGAYVSVANNPSAVFYNPAGIAWLEGTQVSLGSTWMTCLSSLQLPRWPDPRYRTTQEERQWFYPSNFFLSTVLSDKAVVGFGFFSAYGVGTKWPRDYPFRFLAVSKRMKSYFFNPTLSLKLSSNLSFGAGISYVYSTYYLDSVRLVEDYDLPLILETSGAAWAINTGILFKTEGFSFGFIWRLSFNLRYRGELTFHLSELPPHLQQSLPQRGSASTAVIFPHVFGLGACFRLNSRLTFTTDVHYLLWSCYERQNLSLDFPLPYADEEYEIVEDWKNSFVFRAGLEYMPGKNSALRAGLFFSQTPQPRETMDPLFPDADKIGFTGGFGYKKGNLVIDFAYQLELFLERKSPNRNVYLDNETGINNGEGIYSTIAHLFGVSIGYKF